MVEAVGLFGNGQKVLRDGAYHLIILEKVSLAWVFEWEFLECQEVAVFSKHVFNWNNSLFKPLTKKNRFATHKYFFVVEQNYILFLVVFVKSS